MRIFLLALCAFLCAGLAQAQDEDFAAREREIAVTDRALADIRSDLDADRLDDVRAVEDRLRSLLAESRERLRPVNRGLEGLEQSIELLGPAPKDGEAPESEPLATRRADLRASISELQGQRTRILSNIDEAGSLLGSVSTRRLALLYSDLAERRVSLFSPALWANGAAGFATIGAKMSAYFSDWSRAADARTLLLRVAILFAAFGVSILMIGPVHRWMRTTFTRRIVSRDPTPGRRVAVAGVKMIARIVPGLIGGFVIIEASSAVGLLGAEGMLVARAIWLSLVAYLLVEGFTSGLFAPAAPNWRIAGVDAEKGKRASALLLAIVATFGAKSIIGAIAEAAGAAAETLLLLDGLSAFIIGGLLFFLCRRALWVQARATAEGVDAPEAKDTPPLQGFWRAVRRTGRLIAILIMAAALAGFIPLADFAASRFYFLALVLAVAWFLRAAATETGYWLESRLRADGGRAPVDDDKQIARFWIGAGVDFVLLLAVAPVVLVLAGLGWRSVRDIVLRAFMGFRVGGVSISFADIFWAIAVFIVILAITRLIQRGLQKGPFAHSRLDIGVQNSLTTLLGYAGLVIALIAGVTALGFNLSNLALIAGALSVGIGFGLQSIVNNFVSGLILLFERPIKVGDWIITASGEGTVRKISVRSTEIETFDRSTIIVPNSELISSTVTNWTHRSKLGRIRLPIGVAYNSDPEKVRDILLKVADEHPMVVSYPEPFVVWMDFGASSLDFELRAYLRDISDGLTVRTQLRYAIFGAFKDAGIEIPFPQQDIYVKSWPSEGQPREDRQGEG